MSTVEEFRRRLVGRGELQHEVTVSTHDVRLFEDGGVELGDGTRRDVGARALADMAELARIPRAFFRNLRPDERAGLFNLRFRREAGGEDSPGEVRVRLEKGRAKRVRAGEALGLTALEAFDVVLAAVPAELEATVATLRVRRQRVNGSVHVALTSPRIAAEPRKGDVVEAGFHLDHEEGLRGSRTRVRTALHRLVCLNGAIVPEHGRDRTVTSTRSASRESLAGELSAVAGSVWRDMGERLHALETLAGRKVPDPEHALAALGERIGLDRTARRHLRYAYLADELGPGDTEYDLFNAITRLATHGTRAKENPAFAERLMLCAGERTLHPGRVCGSCGHVMR